jgi:hypothetical protein
MPSSTLLTSYLWSETRARWREQPWSPLTRFVLTWLLVGVAGLVWLGFAAQESALAARLARLGFDTLVVRAAAPSSVDPGGSAARPAEAWAAPLAAQGELLTLQQIPAPALTPWDTPLAVFTASWADFGRVGASADADADAVWLSDRLPPGTRATVTVGARTLRAVARAPAGWLRALNPEDSLLTPAALLPGLAGGAGRLEVTLFRPHDPGGLAGAERAVLAFFAADGRPPPAVQSPGPLLASLAGLRAAQRAWRAALLALLAGCLLLLYGLVGALEERSTRHTQALLRALGARPALVWRGSLLENLFLANLAALLAAFALAALAHPLAVSLGLPALALPPADFATAAGALLAALNGGVLLSLVPLWRALRRPVGGVLQ